MTNIVHLSRLVFRTELVSKALQCQQILVQFEIEAQRWNQEALLRATNSTLEAKKHHTKGESNSNCTKGEQLKPSMTLDANQHPKLGRNRYATRFTGDDGHPSDDGDDNAFRQHHKYKTGISLCDVGGSN